MANTEVPTNSATCARLVRILPVHKEEVDFGKNPVEIFTRRHLPTNSATSARLAGILPGQKEEVNALGMGAEAPINSAVGREKQASPDQHCPLGSLEWDKWERLYEDSRPTEPHGHLGWDVLLTNSASEPVWLGKGQEKRKS